MLVYLLLVVNFQSWLDPLIILMALPRALAGILWMLFLWGDDREARLIHIKPNIEKVMKISAVILAAIATLLLSVSCAHENTAGYQNTTTATTRTSGK